MVAAGLVSAILVALLGGCFGLFLHEGTHYTVGRIWTSDLDIVSSGSVPLPSRVMFHNPHAVPDYGIRLAGGAVLIWILPCISVLLTTLAAPSGSRIFLTTVLAVGAAPSPADCVAIFKPQVWKAMEVSNREYGSFDSLRVLYGTPLDDV
jgi:hypothetical protein